ncbi:uncharacterized protein LOC117639524 [Thrips palmi]|uniref:Uncharacterized protein LOC117639524 n=1 Tax=Thrips palmi TaxID=161013 RepID=A0A6P8Y554_THRPL|nr:uncharacterized protein LOC117639524 [Thrips palmi]
MSSRKRPREPPLRYMESPVPSKVARGAFSDMEDAQLLSALMKHGPVDISKLTALVPTRNEYQVKQRILVLQRKAQQSLTTVELGGNKRGPKYQARQKVALDQWLDDLLHLEEKAQIMHGTQEELHVRMLPKCMSLIAKYEDHPQPHECAGVNFKNVYGFLENMMLGQPSKNLKKEDAKFLIESLQRLSTAVDNSNVAKETEFLLCGRPQWRFKGERLRTYGKTRYLFSDNEDDELEEGLKILDSAKFNPFQVPKQLIKRNEPLKK